MQHVKPFVWCAAILILGACGGSDDPPVGMDGAVARDGSSGTSDGAPAPRTDGGPIELGGCEAGEPCRCPMATRGGTAYILCPDAVTYAEAVESCASAGMQLATITSAEEQDWIWDTSDAMFISGAKDVWIGLNDNDTEGDFVWQDGSPLGSYTNWAPNQPDNGGPTGDDEDCVEMGQFNDGLWNDQDCSLGYLGFICEG